MKNKAYILDFNLLHEQNLSAEEFIALLRLNNDDIIDNQSILILLEEKQFIKVNKLDNNKVEVREKGRLLIEFVAIEGLNSLSAKKTIKKSSPKT